MLLWSVPLALVVSSVELFSFLALHSMEWKAGALSADLLGGPSDAAVAAESDTGDAALFTPDGQVLHPYLGAAVPADRMDVQQPDGTDSLANYGFGGDSGPFVREPIEGTVVVGVFGGSVAKQFVTHGHSEEFFQKLYALPEFAGKQFLVVAPINYGYKQPQALLTLNYLLALGAHFDMVLLIDGFNDIAMPGPENLAQGVFPFYPRSWNLRMQDLDHAPGMRSLMAQIAEYRERLEKAAVVQRYPVLGVSMTAKLLSAMERERLAVKIGEAELALQQVEADERSGYIVRGPQRYYPDHAAFMGDLVSVWQESSRQMHHIATANGMHYFHVLQPNQYVPGSKPMGPEEREMAVAPGTPLKSGVEEGYPLLQEAGATLRREGIRFYDMTMVFADTDAHFYVDNCCHLNREGNAYFAQKLGDAVVRDIRGL